MGLILGDLPGKQERNAGQLGGFDRDGGTFFPADSAKEEREVPLGVAGFGKLFDRNAVLDRLEQRRARRAGRMRGGGDAMQPGIRAARIKGPLGVSVRR